MEQNNKKDLSFIGVIAGIISLITVGINLYIVSRVFPPADIVEIITGDIEGFLTSPFAILAVGAHSMYGAICVCVHGLSLAINCFSRFRRSNAWIIITSICLLISMTIWAYILIR